MHICTLLRIKACLALWPASKFDCILTSLMKEPFCNEVCSTTLCYPNSHLPSCIQAVVCASSRVSRETLEKYTKQVNMDRLPFQNSLSIYLPEEDNLLKEKHKQMFQFLDFSAQWQH